MNQQVNGRDKPETETAAEQNVNTADGRWATIAPLFVLPRYTIASSATAGAARRIPRGPDDAEAWRPAEPRTSGNISAATCVEDGAVEIDDNAAERAIRALVLGRRNNYLFAGSDAGGETAVRLYRLIGPCRLNATDPHLYLRHVLERIATHPINRIETLMQWYVAPGLEIPRQHAT